MRNGISIETLEGTVGGVTQACLTLNDDVKYGSGSTGGDHNYMYLNFLKNPQNIADGLACVGGKVPNQSQLNAGKQRMK